MNTSNTKTNTFDFWATGYSMATLGCTEATNPYKTKAKRAAWMDGFRDAVADGAWGSRQEYKAK